MMDNEWWHQKELACCSKSKALVQQRIDNFTATKLRMKKFLLFFPFSLLCAAMVLLLTTCAKEYSYEGGKGSAEYTFIGAPGECAQSVVSGNFYIDTALTPANTVTLMVDVTVGGSYNVSTNSVNGISFSATGNFSDTGIQKMVMKGDGTPDTAGAFIFAIPGTAGCSFTINVVAAPPADFVLSGSPNDCTNPVIKGDYVAGMSMSGSDTININVTVNSPGPYTVTTDTVDGINFSASGKFAATGDQVITLKASGTPNDPGIEYFTVKAGGSQCTFPLHVINGPPLATYVLESGYGVPNAICIHTVNGYYYSATPLSASNTIKMQVYVAETGKFTISTEKINGMMFSLSGTFTEKGDQFVYLVGSGTPINSGKFTFIPQIIGPEPLGGETCAFDVDVQ
jgi:hypothetical protein